MIRSQQLLALSVVVLGTACTKPSSGTSPSSSAAPSTPSVGPVVVATNWAAGSAAASGAKPQESWATCTEPTKLVQLGTLKQAAKFDGEVLDTSAAGFDPETLAPATLPPKPQKPHAQTPSRYQEVVAGRGLIFHDEPPAIVEDVATKKVLLKAPICSAGGAIGFTFSKTGRFLICDSSRSGQMLWDLNVPSPNPDKPLSWGAATSDPSLFVSPNDAYAIATPVLGFGTELPSRDAIVYFDLNTHKDKSLGAAPIAVPDKDGNLPNPSLPFGVAFCGEGALFVVAESKELAVYRGADAQKLASAPSLQGGDVSFSASGRYVSQTRGHATTVYRLER